MKDRPQNLWAHWLDQQKRYPNKIVLIDAEKNASWSARALTEAALLFSERLLRYRAGERIAFRLPNGPEWLSLFLALQRAGLVAAPLDGGMPAEGCAETARRLGARTLYLDGEFQSLGQASARSKKCCCVKITSGSGALPKAVECGAEHLLADGRNIVKTMGIRKSDRNLAVIPLGHSYGLGNLVMPLILQGTGMICASDYVPRQLIEWIGRYRITVFPAVPALIRVLAALPPGREKLDSLRTVISAGAALAPAVAQAFFERHGIRIHNFYGSSETGGICYDRTGGASLSGRSVGKPLAGVIVTVKAGRVTVESPAVATRGSRRQMDDLGEWNKRGELVLLGRVGQGANIGGKKVHPLEVERVLRSLPGVTDTTVWLWRDQGRDFLAAGVETAHSRADLEQALAARLPAWKLPKFYFIARELPRTPRGKLDLDALKRGDLPPA
ncbi:MAG: acyl--CoA ligase [Methylacidiphilales bacterium]|nr:acyl--CoA ligase [Candidatus Methylacidiphilales bacterium]